MGFQTTFFYFYMKKFFLALFFLSLVSQAQSVRVIYAEKQIMDQKRLESMPPDVREVTLAEMKIPKLFILETSDGVSLYERDKDAKDFNYENKESKTIDENSFLQSSIVVNKKRTPFFYYKEANNNLMIFKLTNTGIEFNGKDKLIAWNWEITNENQVINGYNCKKAISRAFNAYIMVWFTEDIAVNAGPGKFDGLPGLILYVNTGGLEFIAEKIEISNKKISIVKPNISESTVTFLEMIDIVKNKFNQVKNSKPIKQGNTTTTTETY